MRSSRFADILRNFQSNRSIISIFNKSPRAEIAARGNRYSHVTRPPDDPAASVEIAGKNMISSVTPMSTIKWLSVSPGDHFRERYEALLN